MLANRLFRTPYPQSPGLDDPSWPMVSTSMAASEEITSAIHLLPESNELKGLDIFDMKQIKHIVHEHEIGEADHGTALAVLLTVERFLTITKKSESLFKPTRNWEL